MSNNLPWSFRDALGYDGLPVDEEKAIEIIKEVGVHASNELGETPLSTAAMLGSIKTINWLIENGAEIDYIVPDNDGQTPLLEACEQKHYEAVNILLKNGANIEATDRFGNTPLAKTFTNCFSDPLPIAKLLILNGAQITERVLEFGDEWNKENFRKLLEELNNS